MRSLRLRLDPQVRDSHFGARSERQPHRDIGVDLQRKSVPRMQGNRIVVIASCLDDQSDSGAREDFTIETQGQHRSLREPSKPPTALKNELVGCRWLQIFYDARRALTRDGDPL